MNDLEKKIQFAVNLFNTKKYTEAQISVEKLMSIHPKIVFLYNLLGLIFTEKREILEAIKIFKKGININSKAAIIYNNLGTAYKINEDYIYEYRDGSNFKLKGSPRNTAGWTSVEIVGKIIEKIGPILATKYIEFY